MVRGHRPGSGSVDLPKSNWVWTDVLHPFWRGFLSVVLGDWGLWAGGQKLWLWLRVIFVLQKTRVSFFGIWLPFRLDRFLVLHARSASCCLVPRGPQLHCHSLGQVVASAGGSAGGWAGGWRWGVVVFVFLVGSSSSREPPSLSLPIPLPFFLKSFSARLWLGGAAAGQVMGWTAWLWFGRLPGFSSGWASVSSPFSPTSAG